MRIRLTRDDVHAGDDPPIRTIDIADVDTPGELVDQLIDKLGLPSISGGKATWCLTSGAHLAVIAQEWSAPRKLPWFGGTIQSLDRAGDVLNVHATYFGQIPPDVVYDVLRRLPASRQVSDA